MGRIVFQWREGRGIHSLKGDIEQDVCKAVREVMNMNSLSTIPSKNIIRKEVGVSWKSLNSWLSILGINESLKDWFNKLGVDHNAFHLIRVYIILRKRGLRFYTTPPTDIPWPWILVNIYNIRAIHRYCDNYKSFGARIEYVLLDVGVDKYWRKRYDSLSVDYGEDFWNTFWSSIDVLKGLSRECGFLYEVTVPDYPDDYTDAWGKTHALWTEECSDYVTNIDRTLENIARVIEVDRKIPWLIPVQGYENIPQSIGYSLETLIQWGLHKRYRLALANLCTSRSSGIVVETVRIARSICSSCSYHIFGPSLKAVQKLVKESLLRHGDSWDSTAWTYPRTSGLWSCKDSYERTTYLFFYMKNLYKVML